MLVTCPMTADYPNASKRQIEFLKRGLRQVGGKLRKLGIPLLVSQRSAMTAISALLRDNNFGAIVTDFNPLKESRKWKNNLSKKINIPFCEIDAHNIIPCWETSNKQEYAAYTIRPKINRKVNEFLTPYPKVKNHPFPIKPEDIKIPDDWGKIDNIAINNDSNISFSLYKPGESFAQKILKDFLSKRLFNYNNYRNDPTKNYQSDLSPYIHFGQISAQQVALKVIRSNADLAAQESFLEELIVRRELSDNFCFYNKRYDSFYGFPSWAQDTLNEHRSDPRSYTYTIDILDSAKTHDELWNAAQKEMVITGKMHGYLRMYWAKKILEWSLSPEKALSSAIRLNNKYELDGHDPNGYAGIAWSIGGVHDRAWSERDIFGKIRYMSYDGCKRKFSIPEYINKINKLGAL
jgi:deoxyribodipyrimidine photo-lyase